MMVARSVVLPTPLRPSTASEPRSGRVSSTSSRTMVSPYPECSLLICRASGMVLLAQVHLVHALVARNLLGRPFDQHLALHQDGDALREAEHEVHVVLDDEDCD